MGSALAVREPNQLTNEQLSYIAGTEFVPQGLRGNKPAILACVMTGRALGLDDMSSLRLIHVVNGRPTFSAELMVQIVRRHGHSISGEVGDGKATVIGKRADTGDTMTSVWTLEMAQRAGLAGKQVWKSYPEAMLWARAVSQLCRMLFADCFAGGTYVPEEIEEAELVETAEQADNVEPELRSPAQCRKLNVLVGTLREAGTVTTEDVWDIVGRPHEVSEDGELHWSPLRDSLTKAEAHGLIEALEHFEPAKDGLTMESLQAWIGSTDADKDRLAEIAKELYPDGTGFKALTDEQRAAVRSRYEELVTT